MLDGFESGGHKRAARAAAPKTASRPADLTTDAPLVSCDEDDVLVAEPLPPVVLPATTPPVPVPVAVGKIAVELWSSTKTAPVTEAEELDDETVGARVPDTAVLDAGVLVWLGVSECNAPVTPNLAAHVAKSIPSGQHQVLLAESAAQ